MRLRLGLACALALALIGAVPASAAPAVVTQAFITNDKNGDNEVDIAINPTDPTNLVAAWNDYGNGNSCGLGYSTDGGTTWHTDWLHGITPEGGNPTFDYGGGDPSVGFLSDGTAILSCAAWGASKSQPSAIYAARSVDKGQHWIDLQQLTYGHSLGHFQDHNMMTIDRYNNRVLVGYTVWNGYAARSYAKISSDGGNTYQGPYEIAADYKRNAVDTFDVSLAGAPDGTVYATSGIWQFVNEWNEQSVVVSQMRSGEQKFTRSVKVRDLVPAPFNLPGESWRTSMQGSIAVDDAETVYLLTGDFVTGNLDMYLAKSADHGLSFPSQTNLTNDTNDQVMPWMSVTTIGRVDTIFYDYNRTSGLMDAVYGQVAPGGSTMSRTTLQTGIDGDAQPPRGAGHTPFWGDYIGIDSLNSLVALAWTCNGATSQEVCSATLTP